MRDSPIFSLNDSRPGVIEANPTFRRSPERIFVTEIILYHMSLTLLLHGQIEVCVC